MTKEAKIGRICWECNTYIQIFADNYLSQIKETKFNKKHSGHMVQTVNMSELNNTYVKNNLLRSKRVKNNG